MSNFKPHIKPLRQQSALRALPYPERGFDVAHDPFPHPLLAATSPTAFVKTGPKSLWSRRTGIFRDTWNNRSSHCQLIYFLLLRGGGASLDFLFLFSIRVKFFSYNMFWLQRKFILKLCHSTAANNWALPFYSIIGNQDYARPGVITPGLRLPSKHQVRRERLQGTSSRLREKLPLHGHLFCSGTIETRGASSFGCVDTISSCIFGEGSLQKA